MKQYNQAITDYSKAIELDPKFAKAYYNRSYAYDSINQQDRAVEDFNKAIELDPRLADTLYAEKDLEQNE